MHNELRSMWRQGCRLLQYTVLSATCQTRRWSGSPWRRLQVFWQADGNNVPVSTATKMARENVSFSEIVGILENTLVAEEGLEPPTRGL